MALALASGWGGAQAGIPFRLEKDPQGQVRPFKAVSVPLPEFVREYSRLTGTSITVGGSWERELKGSVTLFLRRPLKPQELAEVFYRVLGDNGYAVVDAPAGNGWVIQKTREARDAALPVYAIGEVPDSNRYVTAYRDLKFEDAEAVARMMRSFMPANSRIIPTTQSQLLITDTASNIRKLNWVISRMDMPEVAKRRREPVGPSAPPRTCGEQRIEKLVVEKLEIQDGGSGNQFAPREGGKK
ncbi:MAG: hypothetical protein NDJ90_08835 [Oligoflexia bacterium]|nr:hypothetical protein [Oligoflexia bacterium]